LLCACVTAEELPKFQNQESRSCGNGACLWSVDPRDSAPRTYWLLTP
jgi:hypothetical protein